MKLSKLFWIGLIFVSCSVAFIIGLLYLQEISIRKSNYSFTVLFENVQGLHVGDQVDMLGKKIGKVSQTRIIGQKIAVELSIDNSFSFSIPIDSKIEVKSEGLIGSKFISITPGYNRKDFILPGATVAGLREFDFTEITPGIVPLTQDLSAFARQLKAILGQEEKNRIQQTIRNIESFTSVLDSFIRDNQNVLTKNDKENLHQSLINFKNMTSSFDNNVNKEFVKISNILDNISLITNKADDLGQTIIDFKNTGANLVKVSEKLNIILEKLDTGQGTLGTLINENILHDNINGLLVEMKDLVEDFKENPTKYMKAYWKGKK